ncbi:uncharacterized protein Bfra_007287 [Botrytis fragariae]|uniref:Uncharacterized protein n=1 Tax=Botrytis fragariae TaxID=1964551 RepID=A0A8H6AIN2_9HELO|nr:uncharacterized protein Bfra_007287 [Botrytis fragariae]KAF5868092.1 hypothetical protein Bfra_007287 [Botrytis fragariae]
MSIRWTLNHVTSAIINLERKYNAVLKKRTHKLRVHRIKLHLQYKRNDSQLSNIYPTTRKNQQAPTRLAGAAVEFIILENVVRLST